MLRFKVDKLRTEFGQLRDKNYPLVVLMESLAEFVSETFGKDVMVTHIFRPKATQEKIYGKGTARRSPHSVWKAVDIRDWIYTADQKDEIIKFLKQYDAHNRMNEIRQAKSKTVWLHEVGNNGMHFHIQYEGSPVFIFTRGMEITA